MEKMKYKNKPNSTYRRFIHSQTRKAVTATSGVQAIIESPVGAFKVADINQWWFFNPKNSSGYLCKDDNGDYIFEIEEPRLLNRLRGTGIFQNLKRLIRVPPNAQNENNRLMPANDDLVGLVEYFPIWFFCETCKKFMSIMDWWNGWKDVMHNDVKKNNPDEIKKLFTYDPKNSGRPNCYHCYGDAIKKGNKRKYHKLEQVRFVFVSPDGDIKDIDWPKWLTAHSGNQLNIDVDIGSVEESRSLLGQDDCCDKPELEYGRSTKLSDLSGIVIACNNCKRRRTLAGFFNMRSRKGSVSDNKGNLHPVFYKPLIRSSNSVYYPITMNSLFIPQPKIELSHSDKDTIRNLQSKGRTANEIADFMKMSLNDVERVLGEGTYLTETEFRKNEYQYLMNKTRYTSENKDLILEEIKLSDYLKQFALERMIQIKRLKLTSVQTGYTRLSPMDKDVFSKNEDKSIQFDGKEVPLKPRYTVTNPGETEFLMGVESYGEGMFIKLQDETLNKFVHKYLAEGKTKERIEKLLSRTSNHSMVSQNKFIIHEQEHLTKLLLIHSFSHLIIKELEFLCGYPSSSVSERIYCDGESMNGVLIYTIAGSEGSFGGLIRQVESDRFENLLKSGLIRAKDCTSDPICYESDGQGVGGLNYAACYSCLLVSETSCEEFNSFLDRRILIEYCQHNGVDF
jgi:hypothetical protein